MIRYRRMIVRVPVHAPDPEVQEPLPLSPSQPADELLTIEERFQRFHAANPDIYRELRYLALSEAAEGTRRISPKLLFEQLRCTAATATGSDPYRLNNVFTSRYARLLASEPGLVGRIPMRKLQAE